MTNLAVQTGSMVIYIHMKQNKAMIHGDFQMTPLFAQRTAHTLMRVSTTPPASLAKFLCRSFRTYSKSASPHGDSEWQERKCFGKRKRVISFSIGESAFELESEVLPVLIQLKNEEWNEWVDLMDVPDNITEKCKVRYPFLCICIRRDL